MRWIKWQTEEPGLKRFWLSICTAWASTPYLSILWGSIVYSKSIYRCAPDLLFFPEPFQNVPSNTWTTFKTSTNHSASSTFAAHFEKTLETNCSAHPVLKETRLFVYQETWAILFNSSSWKNHTLWSTHLMNVWHLKITALHPVLCCVAIWWSNSSNLNILIVVSINTEEEQAPIF